MSHPALTIDHSPYNAVWHGSFSKGIRRSMQRGAEPVGWAAFYWITLAASYEIGLGTSDVVSIWPAIGVGFAMGMRVGLRVGVPLIIALQVLFYLSIGDGSAVQALFAIVTGLTIALSLTIYRSLSQFDDMCRTIRSMFAFLSSTFVGVSFSTVLAAATIHWVGGLPLADLTFFSAKWFLSDFLGIVFITPALIAVFHHYQTLEMRRDLPLYIGLSLLGVFGIALTIWLAAPIFWVRDVTVFAAMPAMIALALHRNSFVATCGILIISVGGLATISYATGVATPRLVLETQLFMVALVCGALTIHTTLNEIRGYQRTLVDERNSLEERVASRTRDLEDALSRAEQADQLKSEFLANVSHEIRTPLNGIMGMAQMLKRTPLDETQHDFTDTIMSSGTSLLTIIDDVLDISKIEAGLMTVKIIPFDLSEMIERVVSTAQGAAYQKGLRFKVNIDDGVERVCESDPVRVRQVLVNLVGNAVKFTDTGSIEIHAKGARPGWMRFEVKDTGCGIPADQQSLIFERFRQADASSTRKHGGTGLGLAISRDLVELLGGQICVESEPGRGSTFWFEIPIANSENVALESKNIVPESSEFENHLAGLRVLIVEDNHNNQRVAETVLKSVSAKPYSVDNAHQALAALAEDRFDIVLMDINMPGMSGDDAIREIRATDSVFKDVPIIALTAASMKGDKEKFVAAGANGYVSKPLQIKTLFDEMARLTLVDPAKRSVA